MGYDADVFRIIGAQIPEADLAEALEKLNINPNKRSSKIADTPYSYDSYDNRGEDKCHFVILKEDYISVVRGNDPSPKVITSPSSQEIMDFQYFLLSKGLIYPIKEYLVINGG